MLKQILIFCTIILSFSAFSQEICDNGIDDDADGLIDLQDNDCHCGAGLNASFNNAIANPDFNASSCCPAAWWEHLNCLDSWVTDTSIYNNSWSLNYVSSCDSCGFYTLANGYVAPAECTTTVNNGFLAMGFWNWNNNNNLWGYNNFANSCLNTPFYPGNTYVLEFDAFNTHNYNTQFLDDTIRISLLGSTSCANIPLNNAPQTCYDPNWNGLDSLEIVIPVDTTWHKYSFSFSPSDTIYAIALGQSCSNTSNNQTTTTWQRILLDNLTLFDSELYNLQIAESGSLCNLPYVLTSTIDTTGGTWQWYKDSIALVGETSSTIDITTLGHGNYTVLYKVDETCQGLNLEVLAPVYPLAFQTPVNNPICTGDSVYFDGFSFITYGTIDQFYYDFGNGDSAFVEDPVYVFNSPGTFTVNYTAESDIGCTTSQSQIVTIYNKPIVDFLASNQCIYDSVNFISMATVANSLIDSLAWNFNDNSFSNDSISPHLYSSAGTFNIRLFARSDQGCIDSLLKTIVINPAPVASYTVGNDCENTSIPFTNSSTIASGTITNYTWGFDDNTSATIFSPNHTFQTYGTFNTGLLVTSDSGCVDSSHIQLVIYPEPNASFTTNSSCFLANFNNASTIPSGTISTTNWDFGNANTSTDFNTSHYYSANGNYVVNLQTTSNFGCENDTAITITILNNFTANFTPKISSVCAGDPVKFTNTSTATAGQEVNYYWEMSDGQTSFDENPIFSYSNNTPLIDIFLRISTSSGCIDSVSQTAAISVIPLPHANFSFTPEKPTLTNPEVTFLNLSTYSENYWWNFGDNNHSTEINPTHQYSEISKAYTITLTVTDNDSICSNAHSRTLVIQDEVLFFIPNAFTPDGSGQNDLFSPQFISGVDIYHFRLQVFNRWGEIVFESNDPAIGWDGKYANSFVKQDIYIWKIDFEESILDKVHTHNGSVIVLR